MKRRVKTVKMSMKGGNASSIQVTELEYININNSGDSTQGEIHRAGRLPHCSTPEDTQLAGCAVGAFIYPRLISRNCPENRIKAVACQRSLRSGSAQLRSCRLLGRRNDFAKFKCRVANPLVFFATICVRSSTSAAACSSSCWMAFWLPWILTALAEATRIGQRWTNKGSPFS